MHAQTHTRANVDINRETETKKDQKRCYNVNQSVYYKQVKIFTGKRVSHNGYFYSVFIFCLFLFDFFLSS